MSSETAMAAYYAARAQEYERIYQKPERQEELAWLRQHLAERLASRRVLEIACGTGYWTAAIASRTASVLATDFNEEVLAIARAKRLDEGRVKFARADAYDVGTWGEETFDAVLVAFWWSHVPRERLAEFLTQLHRRLGKRAWVIFVDNCYVPGSSTPISRRDVAGNTYQSRKLDDGTMHEVIKNFPSEEELREAVGAVANNIEVRVLQYFWVLEYEVGDAR